MGSFKQKFVWPEILEKNSLLQGMGRSTVLKVCSHKYAFSSNIPCETMVYFYKEEDKAAFFFVILFLVVFLVFSVFPYLERTITSG